MRLLAAVALAVLCTLAAANAQAEKIHRIGVVFWRIPPTELQGAIPRHPGTRVLRESLAMHGWVAGKNVEIVLRSAEGEISRLDRIFDELVKMPVDVLALSGNEVVRGAMRKTRRIPIVMMISTAPVESGLVASLARPGGNVTGFSTEAATDLNGKRLELLKQAAPQVTRVAFLHDTRINPMSGGITPVTEAAAWKLGIALLRYGVDTLPDLERALEEAVRQGANGVFVDTSLSAPEKNQSAFHRLAERYKLPVMHTYLNAVATGGLMYYGPAQGVDYRGVASFIDRILRGARPAEMPVEQPSSYELVINLKAARAIGLSVPESLLAQANRTMD